MATGIRFKETMAGYVGMGETDPVAGARKGRADGTRLAMHAEVSIASIDDFLADPEHVGGLSGSVDYQPIGGEHTADDGLFRLFSPSEEPDLRYMVYQLKLDRDGAPHLLSGRKHVRDDSCFDLWRDTTTLHTLIHEGEDENAPALAAGILRLDLGELLRLLSTLETPGATSIGDKTDAVSKFGLFFMGELWRIYGPST